MDIEVWADTRRSEVVVATPTHSNLLKSALLAMLAESEDGWPEPPYVREADPRPDFCVYCGADYHKPQCPVTLAKKALAEMGDNCDDLALTPDEAERLGDALVAAAQEAGAISDIEQEICDSFDKGLG